MIEQVNVRSVVLNLYYLVGEYVGNGKWTENFGEIFFKIANSQFGVYISYLQIYLKMFFSLLRLVTEKVVDNYLAEPCSSKQTMPKIRKRLNNAKGEPRISLSSFHSFSRQICRWIVLNIIFCCICSILGNFIVCSDYFFIHLALVFREKNMDAVDEHTFAHTPLKCFLTCLRKTRVRFCSFTNLTVCSIE